MSYRLVKAMLLAICLLPLGACKTAPRVIETKCVYSVPLAHEKQIAKSEGGPLSREELLEDDIEARGAHEGLRMKFNQLADDASRC